MTVHFPELEQVRVSVGADVREQHLAAVTEALRQRESRVPGRGRLLAVALAVILLLPVVALAAEDAVPGDFLYPVKRAVEPVVQVFDASAPAERRVREVEVMLEREVHDDAIARHVDVARSVIEARQQELSDRVDRVEDELAARRDRAQRDKPVDERAPPDQPEDQPVVPTDRPPEENSSTTTSTTTTVADAVSNTGEPKDRRGDG